MKSPVCPHSPVVHTLVPNLDVERSSSAILGNGDVVPGEQSGGGGGVAKWDFAGDVGLWQDVVHDDLHGRPKGALGGDGEMQYRGEACGTAMEADVAPGDQKKTG